ncbi:TatD family hydrolase [Candidatus Uhrbacteria bacterium]|nr:TatD family hydrolase [Candidatus Uhrbacteria bacterium]
MQFFDTHCHVHFQAYKKDMDEIILRSLERDTFMITVGTQSTTSRRGLEVAENYRGLWATVGLHPNHTCEQEFFDDQELGPQDSEKSQNPDVASGSLPSDLLPPTSSLPPPKIKTRRETFDIDYYRSLCSHPKCLAIGEVGLDYYRLPEGGDQAQIIKNQKQQFRLACNLADEVDKPLVIHCRDAHADLVAILDEYLASGRLTRRGVVHCFTGTLEEAQRYVDRGFLVSFTGILTFPPRKGEGKISPLQAVVQALPLSSIMIETDAPYLAPVPYRGERNEPWMVQFVAQTIADIKGVTVEEVAKATFENAKRLFGI